VETFFFSSLLESFEKRLRMMFDSHSTQSQIDYPKKKYDDEKSFLFFYFFLLYDEEK
jgi:hypothetical protein